MGSPEPDSPLVVRGLGTGAQALDGDVLDHGSDRRPRRGLAIVAALVTAAAIVLGYLRAHSGQQQADPARSSAPAYQRPVIGGGDTCATQVGKRLVLGAQVVNRSTVPIELQQAQAVLPLNGLRFSRAWWTDCAHVIAQATQPPYHDAPAAKIAAGQTGWVSMVFDVLVDCPAPLPVDFFITYSQDGRSNQATVSGFRDLGDLTYAPPLCTGS